MNHSTDATNTTMMTYDIRQDIHDKLEYGPVWIWIGVIGFILIIIVCMVKVICQHMNKFEETDLLSYHRLGEPTIAANFPGPLMNDKAPGLAAKIYNCNYITVTNKNLENTGHKKAVLPDSKMCLLNL
uniref:Uncharacterized protein n=1 Tax=Arion vulgaris TaxID=1028688 RepID=A0A0B7BL91_9EUPU